MAAHAEFQSTHPVWGGTCTPPIAGIWQLISIHPPRVGWDYSQRTLLPMPSISIHPPRVGWDGAAHVRIPELVISIHPPRVGWDAPPVQWACCRKYFNPPTPCGVGPYNALRPNPLDISIHPPRVGWDFGRLPARDLMILFQSTHPVWGGTRVLGCPGNRPGFQSTHPVWGGTAQRRTQCAILLYFNPPTPCGVGLYIALMETGSTIISIHPPRVGWDSGRISAVSAPPYFNPPTPCGVGR